MADYTDYYKLEESKSLEDKELRLHSSFSLGDLACYEVETWLRSDSSPQYSGDDTPVGLTGKKYASKRDTYKQNWEIVTKHLADNIGTGKFSKKTFDSRDTGSQRQSIFYGAGSTHARRELPLPLVIWAACVLGSPTTLKFLQCILLCLQSTPDEAQTAIQILRKNGLLGISRQIFSYQEITLCSAVDFDVRYIHVLDWEDSNFFSSVVNDIFVNLGCNDQLLNFVLSDKYCIESLGRIMDEWMDYSHIQSMKLNTAYDVCCAWFNSINSKLQEHKSTNVPKIAENILLHTEAHKKPIEIQESNRRGEFSSIAQRTEELLKLKKALRFPVHQLRKILEWKKWKAGDEGLIQEISFFAALYDEEMADLGETVVSYCIGYYQLFHAEDQIAENDKQRDSFLIPLRRLLMDLLSKDGYPRCKAYMELIQRNTLKENPMGYGELFSALGIVLYEKYHKNVCCYFLKEGLKDIRRRFGDQHQLTLSNRIWNAHALLTIGEHQEAVRSYIKILDVYEGLCIPESTPLIVNLLCSIQKCNSYTNHINSMALSRRIFETVRESPTFDFELKDRPQSESSSAVFNELLCRFSRYGWYCLPYKDLAQDVMEAYQMTHEELKSAEVMETVNNLEDEILEFFKPETTLEILQSGCNKFKKPSDLDYMEGAFKTLRRTMEARKMKRENTLTKYKELHDEIIAMGSKGITNKMDLYVLSSYIINEQREHESTCEEMETVFQQLFENHSQTADKEDHLAWFAKTFVFVYLKLDCVNLFEKGTLFNNLCLDLIKLTSLPSGDVPLPLADKYLRSLHIISTIPQLTPQANEASRNLVKDITNQININWNTNQVDWKHFNTSTEVLIRHGYYRDVTSVWENSKLHVRPHDITLLISSISQSITLAKLTINFSFIVQSTFFFKGLNILRELVARGELEAMKFIAENGLELCSELVKNFEIPEPTRNGEAYQEILQGYFQFLYNLAFDYENVRGAIAKNACIHQLLQDVILLQNPILSTAALILLNSLTESSAWILPATTEDEIKDMSETVQNLNSDFTLWVNHMSETEQTYIDWNTGKEFKSDLNQWKRVQSTLSTSIPEMQRKDQEFQKPTKEDYAKLLQNLVEPWYSI